MLYPTFDSSGSYYWQKHLVGSSILILEVPREPQEASFKNLTIALGSQAYNSGQLLQ